MVHNGIEYGIMAAYAEGLNVLITPESAIEPDAKTRRPRRCATRPHTSTTSTSRRSLSVAARQRDRLVAARPHRACADAIPDWTGSRAGLGLGRGSLDGPGGHRRGAPVPVLSAALYSRFESAARRTSPDKVLSAMRKEFGGHHEKKE